MGQMKVTLLNVKLGSDFDTFRMTIQKPKSVSNTITLPRSTYSNHLCLVRCAREHGKAGSCVAALLFRIILMDMRTYHKNDTFSKYVLPLIVHTYTHTQTRTHIHTKFYIANHSSKAAIQSQSIMDVPMMLSMHTHIGCMLQVTSQALLK